MSIVLFFWKVLARLMGRNVGATPAAVIAAQLNEPRPLPQGRQEFMDWSNRIIDGAMIPCNPGDEALLRESQRFALADMVTHLGPTESHKPDAYFIHCLRKVVANQVCITMAQEIKRAQQERTKIHAVQGGQANS
jgi:hypothetical protein